jgi:hypothetical protein
MKPYPESLTAAALNALCRLCRRLNWRTVRNERRTARALVVYVASQSTQ